MFARKGLFLSAGRSVAVATVAALALTAIEPSLAFAGAPSNKERAAAVGNHGVTDFSSRARGVRRGGGGGAAAAAAFAGIVGTGIAIAAAQNNRDNYDSYNYYGGPTYYGGGPYYGYGGGYGSYRSGVPYVHGHPLAGW